MKVLIIAHNPLSPVHSIGKTLISLFSQFQKEELCQIYVHTGEPTEKKCASYYQVTDADVLKGVFFRKVSAKEVLPSQAVRTIAQKNTLVYRSVYGSKNNRMPYRELLRDMVWDLAPWYSPQLRAWIEREKPTHVFVAIGSGKFLYKMAVRISRDYSLPLLTYVCDDFYSMQAPAQPLGTLWKKQLECETKKLMEQSSAIVSICHEMAEQYAQEFQREAITVMTGTNYQVSDAPRNKQDIQRLCYFGKLSLNRYKSMADICRMIDRYNASNGKAISVEIYCGSVDQGIEKEFDGIQSAHFHDFITGTEFESVFFNSDALIHTEAFDAETIDRVKNSISTKIADSLASGIPLLAYGPSQIASVQHLIRNECAFVATSQDELEEKLVLLLNDAAEREKVTEKAIKTAEKYHDPKKVSEILYDCIRSL